MVEAVHRQTEGNPLFVTEVVRLLVQEGELTQVGEAVVHELKQVDHLERIPWGQAKHHGSYFRGY